MSKQEKIEARINSVPADLTWDELVTYVAHYGFKEISGKGGSYRCFVSTNGQKIFLHKPHPGNIVKRYAVRDVIAKLKELGITKTEGSK